MAIRKRFAISESYQDRLRDQQGKFVSDEYLNRHEESQLKSGRVSWSRNGNTYIREEKEKFDVSTLFLYVSIVAIIIFK